MLNFETPMNGIFCWTGDRRWGQDRLVPLWCQRRPQCGPPQWLHPKYADHCPQATAWDHKLWASTGNTSNNNSVRDESTFTPPYCWQHPCRMGAQCHMFCICGRGLVNCNMLVVCWRHHDGSMAPCLMHGNACHGHDIQNEITHA